MTSNPAPYRFVEDQAIDRVHRIGQKHGVIIHRLLIAGTVQDMILQLHKNKRKFLLAFLHKDGARGALSLTMQELFGLFRSALQNITSDKYLSVEDVKKILYFAGYAIFRLKFPR